MAFTEDQQRKIDLFRASVRLQSPETERDAAYKFTDTELWDILVMCVPVYNMEYTIDTLPDSEIYFPLILAKKEIYHRLAASTAPFYPLAAEGAKLEKNVRFDHYMLLIRQVDREYRTMLDTFISGDGVIKSYEAKLLKNYYSFRSYNQAERQTPKFELVTPKTDAAEFTWSKFDLRKGMFYCYKLFVTQEPIIDEFAEYTIQQNVEPSLYAYDIHRTKWRVTGLKPDTIYLATLVSFDANGLYGYVEQTFRTLP